MPALLLLTLHILVLLVGLLLVLWVLFSAIRSFVVPRSINDPLTRRIFVISRAIFDLRLRFTRTYAQRDSIMAFYAPVTLLIVPGIWLAGVLVGYMLMYWGLGVPAWRDAFRASGSALLTLGFAQVDDFLTTLLTFTEAIIGLLLLALLIAYLPTMYSAFSKREAAVTMLEVRAGSPPSAAELLLRHHRLNRLDHLHDLWEEWEEWFVELDETHTSLPALAFFRSPQPHRSWITAAGTVLDSASLVASTLDLPKDAHVDLCIRAGYLALRHIADFFKIPHDPTPKPTDPISIRRSEFDAVCDELAEAGLALKPDREQAWRDYVGWRVNYDRVLLALAKLTMAPEAPWSSDRPPGKANLHHL